MMNESDIRRLVHIFNVESKTTYEDLIKFINEYNISFVFDVRLKPIAKDKRLNKNNLEYSLSKIVGVNYISDSNFIVNLFTVTHSRINSASSRLVVLSKMILNGKHIAFMTNNRIHNQIEFVILRLIEKVRVVEKWKSVKKNST